MDRLEAMAMLLVIVEQGSLSAASRKQRVSVPTLSHRINDLEAQLHTKLLIRSTRKLTLTDTGTCYLVAARRILDLLHDAEQEAAGEYVVPTGELVITAPILFGRLHVMPIAADLLALYSEINVKLVLADRSVHLIADNVGMAVRIGELPDSEMIATRVGSMRTVICASP